ncbi:helix-turn-helix domain-containing protein [Methylobacterium nonmethylotrophicum]|uniref:Cyclic nucleotide-binding domain-containing protein n=1 Tax=Methylobacterium nonmethylotrophicum TaxID=1141884 RepID=A0A4Z0NQM7_9HYPH|nr:helix-turn-helix domain-containing protein [Methylobacterium nonmethylotrophicum]TGD98359.1 cyclic nucleotide-binding domain-containing protein [Methylobacterium nonmethylotrophicum]
MQTALATTGLPPVFSTSLPGRALPLPATEARPVHRRTVAAEAEIFAGGDRAGTFYKVVSGVVRTYRLLSDGRRQIDAFHLPGDIFGLEAGAEHRFNAEAVTEARLDVHRREPRALAGDDGALAREIVASMMKALERAQEHMMLLGRKSARERIATFLLTLSRRMACDGAAMELPMSRTDMADHLGLTVESVSRAVTQLERDGLIALPPNRRLVVLRDVEALARLAE